MKSTTRGTLAAVLTCLVAAAGAASATSAAAIGTVPVSVPLDDAEKHLDMELPEIGGEIPLTTVGTPDGPRHVEGRYLPDRVLPRVPIETGLPGAGLRTPVPAIAGDESQHLGVETPASGLRTASPGVALDSPLIPPSRDNGGLPERTRPQAGVVTPVLETGADLVGEQRR
jgi:hypothetical protein